jgi:predicted Zn-dependent peptidase
VNRNANQLLNYSSINSKVHNIIYTQQPIKNPIIGTPADISNFLPAFFEASFVAIVLW